MGVEVVAKRELHPQRGQVRVVAADEVRRHLDDRQAEQQGRQGHQLALAAVRDGPVDDGLDDQRDGGGGAQRDQRGGRRQNQEVRLRSQVGREATQGRRRQGTPPRLAGREPRSLPRGEAWTGIPQGGRHRPDHPTKLYGSCEFQLQTIQAIPC